MIGMVTMLDRADIGVGSNHIFGVKKPGGERAIVTGCSHDGRERLAVKSDFEWLFDCRQIRTCT
jgi:hypothetical protein